MDVYRGEFVGECVEACPSYWGSGDMRAAGDWMTGGGEADLVGDPDL